MANEEKKTVRRKPVYVFIPVEFDNVKIDDDDNDDSIDRFPSRWAMVVCAGGDGQKSAIQDAIASFSIQEEDLSEVLMFRADPITFEIERNVAIKF